MDHHWETTWHLDSAQTAWSPLECPPELLPVEFFSTLSCLQRHFRESGSTSNQPHNRRPRDANPGPPHLASSPPRSSSHSQLRPLLARFGTKVFVGPKNLGANIPQAAINNLINFMPRRFVALWEDLCGDVHGRCSRSVGMALIPIAIVCMLANALLLFPDMKYQYLTENHVTREATWSTGIWASGLLVSLPLLLFALCLWRGLYNTLRKKGCCYFTAEVLRKLGYTCLAVLAAGLCFVVSGTGLALGPLCLHNSTEGPKWGRPLKQVRTGEQLYLYAPERWSSACVEPRGVVVWNVTLFSVLMAASGLQLIFCALHLLAAVLEFMCGPGFGKNKVVPA
ncbi:transmembrane 4 L6 family member 5 [Puntigrus tetrazona]|uniref:transmembrane 4 L6 family member 5 n=1 Tax=Puntigrus tetrazona TaxID=1606681 RepID=UPI001C89AB71|nr:transmembrane 4 L6 family member 5 [Puntigrus tetrazona]